MFSPWNEGQSSRHSFMADTWTRVLTCVPFPPQGSIGIQGPQGPPGKEGQRVSRVETAGRVCQHRRQLFLSIKKNKINR